MSLERYCCFWKNIKFLLILSFSFIYGLRTVASLLIGASDVKPLFYLMSNIFFGSFIWALVIGAGGYVFGNALELLLGHNESCEIRVFEIFGLLGALM